MGFNLRLPAEWAENTPFGEIISGTNILITKVHIFANKKVFLIFFCFEDFLLFL